MSNFLELGKFIGQCEKVKLHLAALGDDDGHAGFVGPIGRNILDFANDQHSVFNHLAKYNVL